MNEINRINTGKDELLELALYNDVLDVFLFGIGFFLPLGDYFESIVGGAFDILLLIWMFPIIGRNAIWIFILECIDLTDLITVGRWDVIGWIEVLPFWYFYYKDYTLELRSSEQKIDLVDDMNLSALSSTQKPQRPIIETENLCPECGNKIPYKENTCELCGAKTNKKI